MERSYISNLTEYLKALEQKEANVSKRSRQEEIVKLRAKINQRETKKLIKESTKPKAGSLKINKIDKPLAKLTKGPRSNISEVFEECSCLLKGESLLFLARATCQGQC